MNKVLLAKILLVMVFVLPAPALVGADEDVVYLPPIAFPGPPRLVAIPETNVYAVPDVNDDIFFHGGWWWRPWQGKWYRSRQPDSGWGYYRETPSFHQSVPSSWKNDYRQRRWQGHQWEYQRVPYLQVEKNWQSWERDKHWENQNYWGVRDLKKPPKQKQPRQQK
ncbi:MAG: hypothetical protein JW914_02580 [Syntrophaceae bacterium]|nr:hypothetical protein [Syntrophaceae bacterium]